MLRNIIKILLLSLLMGFFAHSGFATDFYWVGNNGDWSDDTHWAATSGGIGGVGTPTANDNVIFDVNSSNSTVNISSDISLHNFIVEKNALNLTLISKPIITININGIIDIKEVFTNEIKSKIYFSANQNQIYEMNFGWYKWKADFYFDGAGTYLLKSPIQAHENAINLIGGTIDLAGNDILCSSFISNSNKKRKLISPGSAILAYKFWKTSSNKFSYNFSQTRIYVISSNKVAIEKGGTKVAIKQSGKGPNDKALNNPTINSDTVSCGNACDGSLTVDFSTTCPNGFIEWLPGAGDNYTGECGACAVPGPNPSGTITNLCPGIYTAVISNDCDPDIAAPQASVSGHPSIVPIFQSATPTSCNGVCDGTTNIIVTGAPYAIFSYLWLGQLPTDTLQTLSNLCAGSYNIEVDDAFGCIDTFNLVITEPDSMYATVTAIDPLCFGECTGSLTSNPVGGTAPYFYSWTPATGNPAIDTVQSFTNLCPNIAFTVNVTDSHGCINDTTITLVEPTQIQLNSTSQNISCGGADDGTITVSVLSGGVAPYNHNWSNGQIDNNSVSSTISSLAPGNYSDTIRDANGCDTILTFTITQPPILTTTTNITNVTCNGLCDGTAKTNPVGGTAPYTFFWTSLSGGAFGGQLTDSIFNLCAGQYVVTVTDVGTICTFSDTITILEPTPIVVNPSSTNITCNGFNDGTATVSPTGGTGNPAIDFTYSWTGPSCAPCLTQSIVALLAGQYIVTVTDSSGCPILDTINIIEPAALNLVTNFTNETCFDECDGGAGVSVTGGTGNSAVDFTFLWISVPGGQVTVGQGTDTIINLCAGIYTINITDSVGCTANSTDTITPQPAILGNLVTSNLSCNSICNGTATVSPTGGNGPYTVSWDGAAAINIPIAGSNTISNLCAIAHTALITDANGCTLLINFNLTEPQLLTTLTSKNDVSCFGLCDGNATTVPNGGTAPYTFSWDSIPTGAGFPIAGNPINNLCAGMYILTVTDDSLCTFTDTVEIFAPLEIFPNVTFSSISCNGLSDGTATSLPTGGSPGYTFNWSAVPGCYLGPTNSQSINSLCAGTYTLIVSDTNNCTAIQTINVVDPQPISVSASATGASCGAVCDGTALATVIGGTPGFSFAWTGPSGPITGNPATGLCVGIYTVTVTDTNGCTAQDTTEILPLIQITINPTIIGVSCNGVCDGTATVFPIGGTQPYTYLWNAPAPNTDSTISGLCPGFIIVTVTDDLGCSVTDSLLMPVAPSVLQTGATITQQVSCAGACDAIVTHAPTGGVLPYTSVWTLPFGVDTNNVCPTSAIITVTDGNNCVQSDTLVIIEPTPMIPNDVVVDVLCNGDTTGSITLNPTNGTGILTFLWTPNVSSTNSASGLGAGIYQILITDANGCSITVIDTINEPPVLSTIPLSLNISCFGLCDGMASVIVNGGVSPYNYNWAPNGETTDTLFNLCAPNLSNTVTVTDDNGCITTQTITINEPPVLNANISGTSIACDGACIGTAVSNPIGGTGVTQFLWSANAAPNILTNPAISNLCLGNYLITVTDVNGCVDTASHSVTAPPPLNITLDSTNITCNGDNNGTAVATPVGGTGPFVFSWVGGSIVGSSSDSLITNLTSGVYTVTVTDVNNCIFIGSVTIIEPNIIDDNEIVTNANCNISDGSITMFPSGGTPPYTHSWSNSFVGNPNQNLAAGFYTDTITDFLGCIGVFTIAITNPAGPAGVTSTVNDAKCFGSCDGSLNVIVIGGAAPFNYAWSSIPGGGPYANDSTLTGLCAGTYNLTLTEVSTGCILAETIVVDEADSISANSSFTDASCDGFCNGSASVTPTGGTAPYDFLWSTGATTSSISGLCVGLVSVTITDFNNCTKTVGFTINSPTPVIVNSGTTQTTCNGTCDGTGTSAPSGGTGSYSFQWNDPLSQTTQTATALCPGNYTITITDASGCTSSEGITIIDATPILANELTTNSTCGNSDGTATVCASSGGTGAHTYSWTSLGNATSCSVNGLAAGTYPVIITDANSCSRTFLISVSDINGPTVSVNINNATCNGVCDGSATATAVGIPNFTFLWQTGGQTTPSVAGLCSGNYTVEVTDGNGCTTSEPVTISDNIAITATVSTTDVSCNGDCNGTALVTPTGGTPPYNFSWTGGNAAGQSINAVGGLCAGNYTVTISDFLGCSFIQNVTINEPNILTVSTSGVSANCSGGCDGSATATPTGGTAPHTFLWSNGGTTPTITALCAGVYSVVITDVNGCTGNANVTIGDGTPITATITKVDVTGTAINCALCDGSITVSNTAGGSGGPYTLLWSTGETTATISNLCPGAYDLIITDNAGCTQTFTTLINNQNGQATLNTLANDVSCFGSCDGIAFTTPIGGLGAVSLLQWDDPNLTTNDTATALCAGFYTVIMQDVFGCITVDTVTVNQPSEINGNITFTEPNCNGVCDGTAIVSPTNGVGAFTVSWDGAAPINIAIGASNTITGLCAGLHTALITDLNNCVITESFTLTDPTPISITASTTPATCNGDCDGSAIANASGGNPGYTYSWNTSPIQNNSLIGGLCAGSYIVTVTDITGCIDTTSVQVINPTILTTVSTPTLASCNGVCDANITTNPNGGSGPYRYSWSNGDTTQIISNLCVGNYIVTVIDANNCTVFDTVSITEPPLLDAGLTSTDPTCNICDGAIVSTPVGGVGPFDFVWTDPLAPAPPIQTDLGSATSSIVGLCAASYNLQITDQGTGCIANYVILLNSSNGPTLILTSTDESCASACDGTATATPSGGITPYLYSWVPTGPPTATAQTANSLCAGLYTVTVTDSIGCIISDTISINTVSLNLTITSVVPETCFGDCDGSATVSATGGLPIYTFSWDAAAANQITAQATNLCVGNYTVTVSDALNCSNSINANITGPDLLTVTATVNSPISCFGNCDGVAIASEFGGSPNYTYLWDDPLAQTTQIATGLCSGTYIVVVTDNNGCSATDTVTFSTPNQILANETFTNPACGVCDGAISLNPSGGVGPYTYLWTTPTSPPNPQLVTANVINLCAGAYSVTISDLTGCSATYNFALSNVNAPIAVLTNTQPLCNSSCDGSITSVTTGGVTPYTFLWSPNGETTSDISNLCSGIYTLSVTDSVGCIGVVVDTLTEPDVLQANLSATNINCNGVCDGVAGTNVIGGTFPYNYLWSPNGEITDTITSLCSGVYVVTVTDFNNCPFTDSVTIFEPTPITVTSTQIDASCSSLPCNGEATVTPTSGTPPYTYQWNGNTTPGQINTITGLCFGVNTVIIFDQNNCSVTHIINIAASDTVFADAGLDTSMCIGTTATLNGAPSGDFTNVEWFSLPGMISIGNTNSVNVTPSVIGVNCYVFQVSGVCFISDTVCVTVESLPIVDAGPGDEILEGLSTNLSATGGILFSWTPSTGLSDSTIANPIASPIITTTYFVTVTSPSGCTASDSVIIVVLPEIKITSGITPNGDGKNDVWVIDLIEEYPDNVVEIYNRWGELLFHADGYKQDWDGTFEGKELPVGTYYYIVDLHDETIKPFTGPLTILR